jgi:uncharacterized protein (TIGR03083 family)
MDSATQLRHLDTEARRVAMLDPVSLTAPVPWCGDWYVRDVVGHLSGVQRWGTQLSSQPGTWVRRRDMEPAPAGPEVLAWFEAGIDPMLAVFAGADLDVVVNTWAGERPRSWWLRRLLHETAVHRWDVEAASAGIDQATPIDPEVAVDGIDELFENFLPLAAERLAGDGETMHLHATDAAGEWQLTFTSAGVDVERTHAKGDVAARGPASELLLLLWTRRSPTETAADVFGDASLVDRWQQTVGF